MNKKKRNIACKKYDLCLTDAAKKDLRELNCEDCKEMSNFLKPEKIKQLVDQIEKGEEIRKISRETGVSKNTVTHIQRVVIAEKISTGEAVPLCGCGQPAGHNGWCSHRLAESPKRQKFLMEKWGKLTFDDITKKQFTNLEKQYEELAQHIKEECAQLIKLSARIAGLDEYLGFARNADETSTEEAYKDYLERATDEIYEAEQKEAKKS